MDYQFLAKTVLFEGTSPDEIQAMLSCLGAVNKQFQKGSSIYHAGDTIQAMGLVLSGSVYIENNDIDIEELMTYVKAGPDHTGTGFRGNLCQRTKRTADD